MRTKLSAYCERILEAGWLLALIVAPMFFNIYSDRVFEPDKISLVRTIAVFMAVAWLVRLIDSRLSSRPTRGTGDDEPASETPAWRTAFSTPLVLPTLLTVAAYLVSTLFSIMPLTSLLGSYQRLQGTYTTFSYITIFLIVVSTLRGKDQLERLINTVVVVSFPIALYGILQRAGRDPLPWGGDVTERVTSNMGNAIFISAYLIMAFFLTLERLLHSLTLLLDEKRGSLAHALLTGCYFTVLIAQGICIFFSQSRGPWLGLLAGLYLFVLLWLVSLRRRASDRSPLKPIELLKAAGVSLLSLPLAGVPAYALLAMKRRGLRWMWLSWVFQALFGVAFLVVFNLSGSPLEPLRDAPYVGRLGQVFETEGGTGRVRVLIWEGAVQLIGSDAGRALIGYGPESMHVAYNRVYPPELAHYEARNASPDRAHNETFDALITTGLFGFAAYILLFGSIFYYGLKWLGLLAGRSRRWLFILLATGGSLLGVLIPWVIGGDLSMAGVGLPAGFILGVVSFVTLAAFRPEARAVHVNQDVSQPIGDAFTPPEQHPLQQSLHSGVLIAILATIVAHFVEIHFGIAIVSTRTYFWILAGVLVVVGMHWITDGAPPPPVVALAQEEPRKKKKARKHSPAPAPKSRRVNADIVTFSLVVAFVLTIGGYAYVTNHAGEPSMLGILVRALTAIPTAPLTYEPSLGMAGLLFLTWIVGGIITVAGTLALHQRREKSEDTLVLFGTYAGLTTLTAGPFVLWHAGRLVPNAGDPSNHIVVPYVAILLFIGAIAYALYRADQPQTLAGRRGELSWLPSMLVTLLFAGAILFTWSSNIQVVRADVFYKQGKAADAQRNWDRSIALYEKAISLSPYQDFYFLFLGRAQLEKVQTIADPAEQQAQVERARDTLRRARQLNPLNTDHTANLGRLHRIWAQNTRDEERRQEIFTLSLQYHQEATQLSPYNAGLLNELGQVYSYMGQYDEAEARYLASLALDARYDQTYMLLGDLYLAKKEYGPAEEYYQKALERVPNQVTAMSALGFIYAQTGQEARAIEQNLRVLEVAPDDYVSMRNLALLYERAGLLPQAAEYGEMALSRAPEQERGPLQQLLERIRQNMEE